MQTGYAAQGRIALATLAIAASLAGGAPARASIIQPERSGAIQILYGSPAGQSFTAVDAYAPSVGFWVEDFNPFHAPTDFAVDVLLYEGAGFSGALLGVGTFDGLSPGYVGWADVAFPTVTLVPGRVYTAGIADDAVRWGVAHFSDFWNFASFADYASASKGYAGGYAYLFGAPQFTTDLTFRVGAAEATVPEPGSLGLVLIGVLGALFHARARRRRA